MHSTNHGVSHTWEKTAALLSVKWVLEGGSVEGLKGSLSQRKCSAIFDTAHSYNVQ